MPQTLAKIKKDFVEGLSQISRFWGFPKGMGAIFGVLYLSPTPLTLDEIAQETGLTKGAVSTEIRALARMGLVHRSTKLGDRKDYYSAETDFYVAIRSILQERQNSEFDRAVRSVMDTLTTMDENWVDNEEWNFVYQRVQALQDFFNAIDSLAKAVIRLESLGFSNVTKILGVLK
ncbi:MAG: MarR family transcriptional regulator [Anaerolineales bacterium]|nr:MarR family transcriptional regulator [Anaerolineales bacterium]NUQ85809.1 MarR family transcriptional regulator [Anaerolineales bacterium]